MPPTNFIPTEQGFRDDAESHWDVPVDLAEDGQALLTDGEINATGAEPDLRTREVRNLPDPGELHGNTRAPTP
jgi:hypothetical protein